MSGFMNAELESLRDSLKCGHCDSKFKGTDSQARKVKYEQKVVYCSTTCRTAAHGQKKRAYAVSAGMTLRKGVLAGPCGTCGRMYESRVDKMFCSVDCYIKSDQFRSMCLENLKKAGSRESIDRRAQAAKRGRDVQCIECGAQFYQKRTTSSRPAKKFCGAGCYRTFLAKRFDRWVANPEGMALPQCYDEFLDGEELSCVVDGCAWIGQHLTAHMNQAHGVRAAEFKRAAGFNLSTGVIAKPLADVLRGRAPVGVALGMSDDALANALSLSREATSNRVVQYTSLESREHAKKARALLCQSQSPYRTCAWCEETFQQSTPYGRTLYCTIDCRKASYKNQRRIANE